MPKYRNQLYGCRSCLSEWSMMPRVPDKSDSSLVAYVEGVRTLFERMPDGPQRRESLPLWDEALRRAVLFKGRTPSRNASSLVRRPDARTKQCYYNSQLLLLDNRSRLRYYEGWCLSNIVPIEHAWCMLDGRVLDVTLELADKQLNHDRADATEYYGLEIPLEFVRSNMLDTETAEQLIWKYLAAERDKSRRAK